eukprot:gene28614-37590_t
MVCHLIKLTYILLAMCKSIVLVPSLSLPFFNTIKQRSARILHPFSVFSRNSVFFNSNETVYGFSSPQPCTNQKQRIVVVGGGFGGLYTALQVSKQFKEDDAEIILIDPKDRFVFLPLLYELAVGTASSVEVAPTYSSLLNNSKVRHVQGFVQSVDFDSRTIQFVNISNSNKVDGTQPGAKIEENKTNDYSHPSRTDSESLSYTALVLAVGIQPKIDLVPGAREHAVPFYRLEDAFLLRKRLSALKQQKKISQGFIRVSVVGGGYSGVEVATTVAQTIGGSLNKKIMSSSAPYNRDSALRSLNANGIKVTLQTSVKNVSAEHITLIDESGAEYAYQSDLVIFTAGTEQSPFIKAIQAEKCSPSEIAAQWKETRTPPPPKAGTVAGNIAKYLKSSNSSDGLSIFKYLPLGEMLTLGITDGAISSLGALGRRVVYAVRMPTLTQQAKALLTAGAVTTGKLFSSFFNDEQ